MKNKGLRAIEEHQVHDDAHKINERVAVWVETQMKIIEDCGYEEEEGPGEHAGVESGGSTCMSTGAPCVQVTVRRLWQNTT